MCDDFNKAEWLTVRLAEAKLIDPATAEWDWDWRLIHDPYGLGIDLPDDCSFLVKFLFARRPGSSIWVWFNDLTDDVCEALWKQVDVEKLDILPWEDIPI
jgi:hypothetical protein